MSEINISFRNLISTHYIRNQFRQNIIRFDTAVYVENPQANEIIIRKYETIVKTLRNFGHLIVRLTFVGSLFDYSEIVDISRQIERYCSKSLTEITLYDVDDYLISKASYAMSGVHSVHLHFQYYSDNLELYRIYPAMTQLKIKIKFPNRLIPTLIQSYSHLVEFEFDESGRVDENPCLRSFIRSNPQLKSISITRFPSIDLLQFIADNSMNLIELTLTCCDYTYRLPQNDDNIYLRSVKKLTVYSKWGIIETLNRMPITFERLDELEIVSREFFPAYSRLIEENNRIRLLSLPKIDITEFCSDFVNTISLLAELEELILRWSTQSNAADIQNLMSITKLQKITFVVNTPDYIPNQLISMDISSEWHCAESHFENMEQYVTFSRQNYRNQEAVDI